MALTTPSTKEEKARGDKTPEAPDTPTPAILPDAPKPTELPSNIPRSRALPANIPSPVDPDARPKLEDYNKGIFIKKDDGEEYAIAYTKTPSHDGKPGGYKTDSRGFTHYAYNEIHAWEGTHAEFKELFHKPGDD